MVNFFIKAYNDEFDPELNFYDYILSQSNVAARRNPYILTSHANPLRIHTFDTTTELLELKYFQSGKL